LLLLCLLLSACVTTSLIALTKNQWVFSPNETAGGNVFDLTTVATNKAQANIDAVAYMSVNYSIDGTVWHPFNFSTGGITITYSGSNGSAMDIGHLRFPATSSITFVKGVPKTLTFHVIFAADLEPAMYRFDLAIVYLS
jgi:hypothetical protein